MSESATHESVVPASIPLHISEKCIHFYPDPTQAQNAAVSVQASTGGRIYACTVFHQAGRVIIATSFPLASIKSLLATQPATKGADPRTMQNRPVDPPHVTTIRDYLAKNYPNYVLPPLSITYRDEIGVYTTSMGKVKQGFVVIPDGLMAHITDGQHRFLALVGYKGSKPEIVGALDMQPSLANDAIAVQITIEDKMQRIHQDFADMAMTKPLPKSLLTAYDMRDPVNRLVYDVIDRTNLFKDRIDETSKTLSKKSRQIALANWMRNFVKGAIAPDYFIAEEDMHRYQAQLTDEAELLQLRDELVFMVEQMTDSIEPLKKIAAIPIASPEASKVPELREDVLATTAVGLGISGMVLQYIRANVPDPTLRKQKIKDVYNQIDWMRRGNGKVDSVWTNGGVLDGESIKAARSNIFKSTARILERLQLPLDKKWKKALAKGISDDVQVELSELPAA